MRIHKYGHIPKITSDQLVPEVWYKFNYNKQTFAIEFKAAKWGTHNYCITKKCFDMRTMQDVLIHFKDFTGKGYKFQELSQDELNEIKSGLL